MPPPLQQPSPSPRGTVGKVELLSWAAKKSGMRCDRLEDLRSGVVILSIMLRVFPSLSDRRFKIKWQPRFDHEQAQNWDTLSHMLKAVKLPTSLFDRDGLQAPTRSTPRISVLGLDEYHFQPLPSASSRS